MSVEARRLLNPLDLALQMVLSHLVSKLGAKFGSIAVYSLEHLAAAF